MSEVGFGGGEFFADDELVMMDFFGSGDSVAVASDLGDSVTAFFGFNGSVVVVTDFDASDFFGSGSSVAVVFDSGDSVTAFFGSGGSMAVVTELGDSAMESASDMVGGVEVGVSNFRRLLVEDTVFFFSSESSCFAISAVLLREGSNG